ncbi:MAG: hypothetical protein GWO11_02225, partial [Desulfuromonadales bacterium]|nr:hypothetical protein [Desulfuromonadales bacterium]
MRRFTRRLGLAAQEGGPAAAEFERLNIAVRNIDGSIRGSEEVFDDVVRAIGRMSSAAERAAAASAFFGEDAGPALAPLLGQGIAAIKSYEDELRSLNGVLSEDLVQQAA